MKTAKISLGHGLILVLFGVWGYLASDTPSPTALIPTFFGAFILAANYGMRLGKKGFKYVALALTILILFGLFKPLGGVIGREDTLGIFRVATMMLTSVIATIFIAKDLIGKGSAPNNDGQPFS